MPPRLAPLPPEHSPELKQEFDLFLKSLGFVPNSVLTMQRRPALVRACRAAGRSGGRTPRSTRLRRLIGTWAIERARSYSMAHTASAPFRFTREARDRRAYIEFHSAGRADGADLAARSNRPHAVTDELVDGWKH